MLDLDILKIQSEEGGAKITNGITYKTFWMTKGTKIDLRTLKTHTIGLHFAFRLLVMQMLSSVDSTHEFTQNSHIRHSSWLGQNYPKIVFTFSIVLIDIPDRAYALTFQFRSTQFQIILLVDIENSNQSTVHALMMMLMSSLLAILCVKDFCSRLKQIYIQFVNRLVRAGGLWIMR